MGRTWLLLLLGTCAYVDLILVHAKQVQYRVCREQRLCEILARCPWLVRKLEAASAHDKAVGLLEQFMCGLEDGQVAVCCPRTLRAQLWKPHNSDVEVLVRARHHKTMAPWHHDVETATNTRRPPTPERQISVFGYDAAPPTYRDAEELSDDVLVARDRQPHDERDGSASTSAEWKRRARSCCPLTESRE